MTKTGRLDIFTAFIIKFIQAKVQTPVNLPAFLARQTHARVNAETG